MSSPNRPAKTIDVNCPVRRAAYGGERIPPKYPLLATARRDHRHPCYLCAVSALYLIWAGIEPLTGEQSGPIAGNGSGDVHQEGLEL
jgi:hypothetical protein